MLYDSVLSSTAERTPQAAADRGRSLGSPLSISLLKKFEVYEDLYGAVTGTVFSPSFAACR